MEFHKGEEMSHLVTMLEQRGFEMDFFHAVSLLEEFFAHRYPLQTDPLLSALVRFISDTSITFPPGDISAIRFDRDTDQVQMICSFLGLLGISSPLPNYFLEYSLRYPEEGAALIDFLNIFNHRMYVFFYQAWKKYGFIYRSLKPGPGSMLQDLGYIAGMDPDAIQNNKRLAAYTGLLALPIRSAEGLRTILSDFFNNLPVTIRQWMERWAPVRDLKKIGVDSVLGKTTMMGTHILDISGKFRVTIGPLEQSVFKTFLPDTQNIKQVKDLVKHYCTDALEFDIEVTLKPTDLTPVVLGKNDAALGITSSCSVSKEKTEPYSIVIQ
jgi:type VI secretion system protein ImpH